MTDMTLMLRQVSMSGDLKKRKLPNLVKLAAWNVNGMRACAKKGFEGFLEENDPDVLCLSEVKCNEDTVPNIPAMKKYPHIYWNPAAIKKGGYSGTAVLSKLEPLSVIYGIPGTGIDEKGHVDYEGRVITIEFEKAYVVQCYVPNSGAKLDRLEYRTNTWDPALLNHLNSLKLKKHVIWTGDLNVAHLDIDVHDPISNRNKTAGFTDAERENFSKVLDHGYSDVYRKFYPEESTRNYTYFSYRFNCRAKNKGWRLDYFVVNDDLLESVSGISIGSTQLGSDHLPLILTMEKEALV